VNRQAVGVIEAKKEGTTLSVVADQSARYATSVPDFLAAGLTGALPFLYESTGVETYFRDERDPEPRSRRVFSFHRPETLAAWVAEPNTLRGRLAALPTAHPLATAGMRDCQIEAITGLEESFAENRPRALIHMATGAGKTYTACAFTYRLIKYAGARRVLFLVDRANLGEQARDEFARFRTPDTGRLFTELYNVQHLTSPHIDDVCRVTICTIQRLYSILRGEDLAEGADDLSGAELSAALGITRTREVAYNPVVPVEKFDFIVTDECHRSIYNLFNVTPEPIRRQALSSARIASFTPFTSFQVWATTSTRSWRSRLARYSRASTARRSSGATSRIQPSRSKPSKDSAMRPDEAARTALR
jgi:type I restriction enzyme R subunit